MKETRFPLSANSYRLGRKTKGNEVFQELIFTLRRASWIEPIRYNTVGVRTQSPKVLRGASFAAPFRLIFQRVAVANAAGSTMDIQPYKASKIITEMQT